MGRAIKCLKVAGAVAHSKFPTTYSIFIYSKILYVVGDVYVRHTHIVNAKLGEITRHNPTGTLGVR